MNITIRKKMLVNFGNFSNIEIAVELTKDIPEGPNFFSQYEKFSKTVDAMLMKEMVGPSTEMNSINKVGAKNYFESLAVNESTIDQAIKDSLI